MVLMLARHKAGEPSLVTHYLYRGFLQMLWLEHLGFFTMLASGAVLLGMYGLGAMATAWLEFNLALVVLVIVPIEAADLWFSHRGLPQIFVSRQPDAPPTLARHCLHPRRRQTLEAPLHKMAPAQGSHRPPPGMV